MTSRYIGYESALAPASLPDMPRPPLREVPARLAARLHDALERERARWFNWIPILIGAGIAIYFALPVEPPAAAGVLAFVALVAMRLALPRPPLLSIALTAAIIVASGFSLVNLRAIAVGAPILEKRVGPIEVRGFIELIEPREGRGERLTVLVTRLGDAEGVRQPKRVRVRTMSQEGVLSPGDAVILKAHLAPPAGPALPDGFDFARHAYFAGIGAVGFALAAPVIDADAPEPPASIKVSAAVQRVRRAIAARIDRVLAGETAAIVKALVTGERGGIPQATNAAYRDSGLFHILSISGLHMAIMGGSVFWFVRLLLALFPAIALRYPVKKWAAILAALGSLAYLAISGSSFATLRSFIMISIMFAAILLDRPAIALRNVALSAVVILVLFPESLLDVGFQMSFAAVVALVASYEAIRDRFASRLSGERTHYLKPLLFLGGIVLTTLVASAAVTPFALYHFHKTQHYAVLANLLAVPICNLIVMPAALATLLAMPFGLESGPLWVMGAGVDAMSWTARHVAALPGAVGMVPAMPSTAFALMVVGGLWTLLWHARWRLLGLAAIVAGIALAPFAPRADILIGRDGQLVAIRTEKGELAALPAPQSSFELARWLEHDGDRRSPAEATAAPGFNCDQIGCTASVRGLRIAVSRHPAAVPDDCGEAAILVLSTAAPRGCTRPQAVVDFFAARTAGTHAVYIEGPRQLRIETAAAMRGNRPWSMPHPWTVAGRRLSDDKPGAALDRSNAGADGRSEAATRRQRQKSRVGAFAAPVDILDALRLPRPEIEDEEQLSVDEAAD